MPRAYPRDLARPVSHCVALAGSVEQERCGETSWEAALRAHTDRSLCKERHRRTGKGGYAATERPLYWGLLALVAAWAWCLSESSTSAKGTVLSIRANVRPLKSITECHCGASSMSNACCWVSSSIEKY